MNRNKIIKAIAGRILTSIILLFFLVTFLFFLLRAAPGDPAGKYISAELSPELGKLVRQEFRLNEPVLTQYYSFLLNMLRGEFGVSFIYRRPVFEVIAEFIPFTLIFASIAMIVQVLAGYYSAKYVFRKNKTGLDKKASVVSLVLYSAPTFLLGVVLIMLFAGMLRVLPSSGLKSFDHEEMNLWYGILDYGKHLILPVLTLSAGGIALFYNYFRESLDDISGKPFILNLKANGLPEKVIIRKHIIPNALGPLISAAGVEFGLLLGGALITEVIFGLPGMGRLTVDAILSRDYPLVIGCSFFAAAMIVITNLLADMLKGKIDRRFFTGGILN